MRFSLEESQMNRRVPPGLVLLILPLIYWLSFVLWEGLAIATARDVFELLTSFGIWGFVLGMSVCPLLALVLRP